MIFSHANGVFYYCFVDFTTLEFNVVNRGTPYECDTFKCSLDEKDENKAHFDFMRFSGDINTTFLSNFVKISPSLTRANRLTKIYGLIL